MMPTSILPSVKSRTVRVYAVCFMLASLSVLTLLLCAGCQQTVPSPFTGQDVTADQLVREADAEARKLEREAEEKAATAEKRIKTAQAQARARIREIRGNVEATAAESARIIEGVQDELGVKVAEAETDFTQAVNRLESETADLEATTTAALAAIEAKRQRALGVLNFAKNIPIVGQAAASAGIDLGGLGALVLGGGGALAWQARRGRKLADASWDEATRAAEDNAKARDKAYDEAQADLLKLLTTLPRAS